MGTIQQDNSTGQPRDAFHRRAKPNSKQTQAISNDMGQLAEDARALMAATADVAGEKVGEARSRASDAKQATVACGGLGKVFS